MRTSLVYPFRWILLHENEDNESYFRRKTIAKGAKGVFVFFLSNEAVQFFQTETGWTFRMTDCNEVVPI